MPRRVKEEERTEMIIRGLLKQAENRRCINCNSLGPQYVCTTFWTFVCTNCSGVHREFTHRVKSVSMAKFNDEEIMALQAGGNERAKQIYFKAWDSQRNSYPDGSNLHRLREFVKHVYVDRKYAGENNRLSMIKLDEKRESSQRRSFEKSSWSGREDFLERRSFDRASNSIREDPYERSSFEKSSPYRRNDERNFMNIMEERSPRPASHRSRPAPFEIVDDRFRDDGGVKFYERFSNKESRAGTGSPGSQRSDAKRLPEIRPVKDILGEKVLPLTIGELPKANDRKDSESSTRGQKAADATSSGPSNDKQKQSNPGPTNEKQKQSRRGLTDEKQKQSSSGVTAEKQKQLSSGLTDEKQKQSKPITANSLIDFDANPEPARNAAEPHEQLTASNSNDVRTTTATAVNAPTTNPMESLLLELSAPVTSSPVGTSQTYCVATEIPLDSSTNGGIPIAPEVSSTVGVSAITSQVAHNGVSPVTTLQVQKLSQAAESGDGLTPNARKELPADLFTSSFAAFNPAVAGWQMRPSHGIGYGMQFHHPSMPMATVPNSEKPRNPFDIGDDRSQVQAAMFPSMSSLQGALSNIPAATGSQSQPSPYAMALSSHVPPFGINMPPVFGVYMGQQQPNNISVTSPHAMSSFGRSEDAFAFLNPVQQANGTVSSPSAPNSLPRQGGNPFG